MIVCSMTKNMNDFSQAYLAEISQVLHCQDKGAFILLSMRISSLN